MDVLFLTETSYSEDYDHVPLPGIRHDHFDSRDRKGGKVAIQSAVPVFGIVDHPTARANDYKELTKKTFFTRLYRSPHGTFAANLSYIDSLFSIPA